MSELYIEGVDEADLEGMEDRLDRCDDAMLDICAASDPCTLSFRLYEAVARLSDLFEYCRGILMKSGIPGESWCGDCPGMEGCCVNFCLKFDHMDCMFWTQAERPFTAGADVAALSGAVPQAAAGTPRGTDPASAGARCQGCQGPVLPLGNLGRMSQSDSND